jgi:hypothetical protein
MQRLLKFLSSAFVSGLVSAFILVSIFAAIQGIHGSYLSYKETLYRLMVWGGVWGFCFIIPLFRKSWFIRGSIVGLLVVIFNGVILMPHAGQGYFGIKAGWMVFFGNIIFNYLWGLLASLWFSIVMYPAEKKKAEQKEVN